MTFLYFHLVQPGFNERMSFKMSSGETQRERERGNTYLNLNEINVGVKMVHVRHNEKYGY